MPGTMEAQEIELTRVVSTREFLGFRSQPPSEFRISNFDPQFSPTRNRA